MRVLNVSRRIRFTAGCLHSAASSALVFIVAVCMTAVCRGESPRQFWPLDDGAGTTATNAVPGGNAGTLVNISNGWDSDFPAALTHSTGSLAFGTNGAQYVNGGYIGIAADGRAKSATISVWLKPASLTQDMRLWGQLRSTSAAPHPLGAISLRNDGFGWALCGFHNAYSWVPVLPFGRYTTNEWQHLCFVWQNNQVVTYYNGNPAGGMDHIFEFDREPSGQTMSLGIGARYLNSYGKAYDGKMDDFAVWDGALTAERVRQLSSGVSPLAITPQGNIVQPGPPLASYRMDGDVMDASGNYHGSAAGDATFTDGSGDTPFAYAGNKALQLDGDGDRVSIADTASLRPGTKAWTLSLWFKTSNTNQTAALIGKRNPNTPFTQMGLWMAGTGTGNTGPGQRLHTFVIGTEAARWEAHSSREYADGKWHHVALVRQAGNWSPVLYIDGVATAININHDAGTRPHDVNCTEPWYIGDVGSGSYFEGLIDEVAMWDSALSSEQVAWLAHNSLASMAPKEPALPLVAYRMNNNARDACGEQHGSLAGNTAFVSGAGNTPFSIAGNYALQLDGDSSYVTVNDVPALRPGTNAWTLSLWFKTAVGDRYSGLIAKRKLSSPYTQMSLMMGGSLAGNPGTGGNLHTFLIGTQTSNDRWEVSSRADYADGEWHHAALVRPAGDKSPVLFVDGVMTAVLANVDKGLRPHDINCTEPWLIGSSNSSSSFEGLIDEVAMWDAALTAGEIAWLAQNSIDTLFPRGTMITVR